MIGILGACSARVGMSLCGLSIAGGYRFTWFLDVFENDSARVLFLDAGDQGIAVRVLTLAEVSRLEWSQYEHRQNIENFLKQGIRPGLDRIRKHGDVLKTSCAHGYTNAGSAG